MTVRELIEKLQEFPMENDVEVIHLQAEEEDDYFGPETYQIEEVAPSNEGVNCIEIRI